MNKLQLSLNTILGFPEIIVCLILRDVLLGLEYIHRKGYIHRSIRASHILLNHTKAVLCGFREPITLITNGQRTQRLFDLPSNSVKSLNWLAPEVLEQNLAGYTEKSDIYSIGITTCELANGLEPFANMPTTFMLTEKVRGNQPVLFDCSTCPDEIFCECISTVCVHEFYSIPFIMKVVQVNFTLSVPIYELNKNYTLSRQLAIFEILLNIFICPFLGC